MRNRIRLNSLAGLPLTLHSVPVPDVRLKLALEQPASALKGVAVQILTALIQRGNLTHCAKVSNQRLRPIPGHQQMKHSRNLSDDHKNNRTHYRKLLAASK
jgi:hypothetical protein